MAEHADTLSLKALRELKDLNDCGVQLGTLQHAEQATWPLIPEFEFRLGVAIGAVVARAWSQGAGDVLATTRIATWKETTGFPGSPSGLRSCCVGHL